MLKVILDIYDIKNHVSDVYKINTYLTLNSAGNGCLGKKDNMTNFESAEHVITFNCLQNNNNKNILVDVSLLVAQRCGIKTSAIILT